MNPRLDAQLAAKRDALNELCRRYGVARLDLFGSGAAEDWDAGTSDLDFVVVFGPDARTDLAGRFLGLADALEALFGRPIRLLTERSIRNPYFRRGVEATRTVLYAE